MRMGSSSLSSDSWAPRVGRLLASAAASPAGSDLLRPADVSWVAPASIISAAAGAAGPRSKVETEELPTPLEQEAWLGASATEAASHRCPGDSEEAEGMSKDHPSDFRVQVDRGSAVCG